MQRGNPLFEQAGGGPAYLQVGGVDHRYARYPALPPYISGILNHIMLSILSQHAVMGSEPGIEAPLAGRLSGEDNFAPYTRTEMR